MNLNKEIIKYLLLKNPQTNDDFVNYVRKSAGKYKQSPVAKDKLLQTYRLMITNKEIEKNETLENLFKKRAVRTLSGVAPITVMTAPLSCPNNCLYCPTQANMPKSYLSNQPAAMRAVLSDFHPYKQTVARLLALYENGHITNKIEIIINGGTWSAHAKKYQTWFIKNIFKAVNEFTVTTEIKKYDIKTIDIKQVLKDKLTEYDVKELDFLQDNNDTDLQTELETEQKINETTTNRIIGITLETRPDFITLEETARMRMLGATKIELGVQNIYDDILESNNRGHGRKTIIRATKILKDAGFKVAYHIMPGLYKSSFETDLKMFEELFTNQDFQPDFLKIYPCVVLEDAELFQLYKDKKYIPYSDEKLLNLLIKIKQTIPTQTRLVRLARDIPTQSVIAGNTITNLRELVHKKMKKLNIECKCIRCREPKQQLTSINDAVLNIKEFFASGAKEYFISFESKDKKIIYAFLRLRLPNSKNQITENNKTLQDFLPELKNSAIIREIHTYGKLASLQTKDPKSIQHIGFGKRLMKEAERIALENNYKSVAVISGIGVREYYKKLGYSLIQTYMLK